MSDPGSYTAQLVDLPGESRTTATLLGSLAGRLSVLPLVSGATAVGSLVAGFAALGRSVSRTVEGQRLRRALEQGRAGANGATLWSALHIDEWTATVPPSPVLEQLRNDLALLLVDDLQETVALLPIPAQPAGASAAETDDAPADFLDCAVGLWAFGRELASAVEALAAPTLPPPDLLEELPPRGSELAGPVLR